MSKKNDNISRLYLSVPHEVKAKIETLADNYGVPTNSYLAPYLRAIAKKKKLCLRCIIKGKAITILLTPLGKAQ